MKTFTNIFGHFVEEMSYMQCPKWKRIAAFDPKKKKTIYFELDSNERLKKKLKSKKVSKIKKEISLIHKQCSNIYHANVSNVVMKNELSKNIIIFSRESNIDEYMMNMNKNNGEKDNSNGIKCNLLDDFKILDFNHDDSMIQNELYDLENTYLF